MNPWVVGIDLGGTKIEVGIVAPDNSIVARQRFLDFDKPSVERFLRAGIQRRKRPDNAGLALGDHQVRIGHNKHRRRDHRDAEIFLDFVYGWHAGAP